MAEYPLPSMRYKVAVSPAARRNRYLWAVREPASARNLKIVWTTPGLAVASWTIRQSPNPPKQRARHLEKSA